MWVLGIAAFLIWFYAFFSENLVERQALALAPALARALNQTMYEVFWVSKAVKTIVS